MSVRTPRRTAPRADPAARLRPRLTVRAAVLGTIVLVLGASSVVPLRQYLAQRERIADLERKIEVLGAERQRLLDRIDHMQDPAELERLARECLGMVRPGEIAFVPVPKDGGTIPRSC